MKLLVAILLILTSCTSQLAQMPTSPAATGSQAMATAKEPGLYSEVPPMVEVVEFREQTIVPLIAKLKELDERGYSNIIVRINSYGGSIHWGMELIQAMEALKATTVCVVDWKAMSMGAYLLESGACDVRLMTKRSVILFHEPLVNGVDGNAHALKDVAEQLQALADGLIATASERMEMKEEEFEAKIHNKSWTMSYKEARAMNVVDGWVSPSQLPPLIEVKSSLEF